MFRTEFHIPRSKALIDLQDEIITMGSCFSDTIGSRLKDHKFRINPNPFGTVFNPVSLCRLIDTSLNSSEVSPDELIQNGEIFYHFDLHSDFSSTDPHELTVSINGQRENVRNGLVNSQWLILTLGTAWVYEHKESDKLVSNCHKFPSEHFTKRLLSLEEISNALEQTLGSLKSENPSLNLLLTLSPVRHSKDGMEANQISKSILRLAIQEMVDLHEDVYYFPAYELLLDDLRDYRYYGRDLVHPSEEAIDYIWGKFIHSFMEKESLEFIERWKKIRAALEHKPFHPETKAHQDFLKKTLEDLHELSSWVDLGQEIDQLKKQIVDG